MNTPMPQARPTIITIRMLRVATSRIASVAAKVPRWVRKASRTLARRRARRTRRRCSSSAGSALRRRRPRRRRRPPSWRRPRCRSIPVRSRSRSSCPCWAHSSSRSAPACSRSSTPSWNASRSSSRILGPSGIVASPGARPRPALRTDGSGAEDAGCMGMPGSHRKRRACSRRAETRLEARSRPVRRIGLQSEYCTVARRRHSRGPGFPAGYGPRPELSGHTLGRRPAAMLGARPAAGPPARSRAWSRSA